MLYLVGLGLADETDITVRGLEIVKKADRVYLEAYTSILLVDTEKLVRWLTSELVSSFLEVANGVFISRKLSTGVQSLWLTESW